MKLSIKKNTSDEFVHEMLLNHNVLGGDVTQKLLESVNKEGNEKEVIVDDIDEIPNTGIIIPHGFSNSLNNPLNGIQRRSLLMRNNYQTAGSQFKKIDMLSQVKNIDDITGLNTIHEKRNSMESIETENMNKKSPNVTNSGSSSQNISKTVSRAHSKHPSLDFRIGHSNNSSVDFRPMHSKRSSGDLWPMHSKQSSVEVKPSHSKQSSADFRTLSINKDPFGLGGVRVEKEIDIIKYNLLSPKTMKVNSESHQPPEYIDKRNKFINELQKSSENKLKKGNNAPEFSSASKIPLSKTEEGPVKSKFKASAMQGFDMKDKFKTITSAVKAASKHRRTYSGNVGKSGELISPREDLATSSIFLNARTMKDHASHYDHSHTAVTEFHHEPVNLGAGREQKKAKVDDSMKKLTSKTDFLEGQIQNIFSIIESFACEKATLEDKIQTQDKKIKELMELTTKYQEEIKILKNKDSRDNTRKSSANNKSENAALNILTTTDGSQAESSATESSGFLSNKDIRMKPKQTVHTSNTPHGQNKMHFNKVEDKKSIGLFANKSDLMTKKSQVGAKKPVVKKI